MTRKKVVTTNWRVGLFDWQHATGERLRQTGTMGEYSARVTLGNNTQYTWIIEYPGGRAESAELWQNVGTAMLSADVWLYKHLNQTPQESK